MSTEPEKTETETDTTIITETLPCALTDTEKMEFGRNQARAHKELLSVELQKQQAAKDFGGQIKAIQREIGDLANIVDTGVEWREVECSRHMDYYLGRVKITRTDTGEVIENRPMTHKEAQRRMDL